MNFPPTAKCSCSNCGTHLEFAVENQGFIIDCPACNQPTELNIPIAAEDPQEALRQAIYGWTARVPKTRVSILYQFGLLLVAGTMLLLPVLYVGLIALAGFGLWYWCTQFTFLLGGHGRVAIFRVGAYLAPLMAGVILVFFMVKPLFARRPKAAQPLALHPGAEPLLFAFVQRICEAVGAAPPRRIDVDCQLNAAAGFRRGFFSFFGNDFVLTLGLPLVAGLSVGQLAGILAHEFGHFTQGFAMRLTYVIRTVNFWFARVVYERDAWDVALDEWLEESEGGLAFVAMLAQIGVGLSRQILKLLMLIGHGVGCFMLRQMEYDADSYEIKVAGSEVFESTTKRMHVLHQSLEKSYKTIRVGWNNNRELPDNFAAYLLGTDHAMAPTHRAALEDRVGLRKTGLLDTHPSEGDRIRCARAAADPGVFIAHEPSAVLFSNFDVVARQVTQLHYSDDLGIPVGLAKLQRTEELFRSESVQEAGPSAPGTPSTQTAPRPRFTVPFKTNS